MQQSKKLFFGKCAAILGAVPIILLGFASGPEPRHTGAPGDQTCAAVGCHVGTAVTQGNVELTFSGGSTYTPGQTQRITIRATQSSAVYGFQLTARLASNERNGQAGRFANVESTTIILCEDGRERNATATCPVNGPLEFIEHGIPSNTGVWNVDWTPPATDAGEIKFYVALNNANGNGANTGDRISTANFTLRPVAAGGDRPSISQGGVVDAFTRQTAVASGTWIEIYGQNLAATTKSWDAAPEFAAACLQTMNCLLPTTLEGVSVTVNNRPAPVAFVSPGQVNVLMPADTATGDVAVTVRTAAGVSQAATIRKLAVAPVPYAAFRQGDRAFVSFVDNATGAIFGKPGVDPRTTRAARPGDIVQLYALGLGPTNPAFQTDRLTSTVSTVAGTVRVLINNVPAELFGAALVGPGLYQINLRVPEAANGDHPLVIEVGSDRSASNVFVTIQR